MAPWCYSSKVKFFGRLSVPEDQDQITRLMIEAMAIESSDSAVCPDMQNWKYWYPHPLAESSRSHVLLDGETVIAHGARWPILLRGAFGDRPAFHLIDWAAQRGTPGAGMQILRLCGENAAAVFSIGGSAMTKRILPAFGFSPQNRIVFLARPLHPLQPAWHDSPRDWKMPARLLRNLARFLAPPRVAFPAEWSISAIDADAIPHALFPTAGPGEAVSVRNAALLRHMMTCPRIRSWQCYLLWRDKEARAYFCLARVADRIGVVDYGPARLDEAVSNVLARAVRCAAAVDFADCVEMRVATTESPVEAGFARAGFHVWRTELIKVLKLDAALKPVNNYRLTLLDWDAAC